MITRSRYSASRPRSGNTGLIVVLVLLVAGGTVYFTLGQSASDDDSDQEYITHTVARERLIISVTEDGNLESAENKDVKCEIEGGSTILWIVADGTVVAEGEKIVELDKSGIEEQFRQQEGICEKALAAQIKADEDAGAAKIAVQEYVEGTYLKDKQGIEASIIIARENLAAANNMLAHTQRIARKGFATPLQVQADEFAVQRAGLDLKTSQLADKVLTAFTLRKMTKELEATYNAGLALARSEKSNVKMETVKLARLEKQVSKCVILAPQDGMVVYANERSRYRSSVAIEQGVTVQQNQVLVRLPKLSAMQAKVLVNESKIDQLKPGMAATLKIQDREFTGKVAENGIANQPEPTSWFSAQVKEYAVTVEIDGDVEGLKPGMTAEVEIEIDDLTDELTVPVAAVLNHGEKYYCWITTPSGPERRELLLGPTNDRVIAVRDGVNVDEDVILNPRSAVDDVKNLPTLDEDGQTEDTQESDRPSGQAPAPTSSKTTASYGAPGSTSPGGGSSTTGGGPSMPSFSDRDTNSDGKITKDETSGRMTEHFDQNDTNKDGSIDASEYNAMIARVRKAMSQRQGGSTTPGGPK